MQKKILPILLSLSLVLAGVFAVDSLLNLQGNARVVNYTGVVRGASQKLVKEEMAGNQDDALIKKLDTIIMELKTGEGSDGLIRLDDAAYQEQLIKVEKLWIPLKEEIIEIRNGKKSDELYKMSEKLFQETDTAVHLAEEYTEYAVNRAMQGLIIMIIVCLVIAACIALYSSWFLKKEKGIRKTEEENKKKSEYLTILEKQLRAPMNEISELIYIVNVENYELLFLNETGQKSFHIKDFYGKKCYQVLQGRDEPCPFCNNTKLKKGETISWEFTNEITNNHYLLKDRLVLWDNIWARMEIAFDITKKEIEKQQLQYTLDADKIVVECIHLLYEGKNLADSVDEVLKKLGEFIGSDRAYLFDITDIPDYKGREWFKQGVISPNKMLKKIPCTLIDILRNTTVQHKNIRLDTIDKIEKIYPDEYKFLKEQGIERLVGICLESDGIIVGYLGADNFPSENINNIAVMLQTLSYFIMLAQKRNLMENQLSHMSYHDALTSFYNRNRYIEDTERIVKEKCTLGVIYLDINGLKEINDTYGHARGDELIISGANLMKKSFPDSLLYRIGGDEFVILCLGMKEDEFHQRVKQLKAVFQKDDNLHAAMGESWSNDAANLKKMTAEADAVMYEDKRNYYHAHQKTNRYRHYNDEVLELKNIKTVQEYIDSGSFQLYLQPKISSVNNQIVGAEALIRYKTDQQGILLPKDFLPILEDHDLIAYIDYFIFESTCKVLKRWKAEGRTIIPISVNISQQTMCIPSFLEKLASICKSYEVPSSLLEIEINEHNKAMSDDEMKEKLQLLKQMGFRIALDDFGINYANLALLAKVDFDVLKLDQSITTDLGSNTRSTEIVTMLYELCNKLYVDVIAEGVETLEQLQALRNCDVKIVQGYLYSRPLEVEQFEKTFLTE